MFNYEKNTTVWFSRSTWERVKAERINLNPYSGLILNVSRFRFLFSPSIISAEFDLIFFVALFISFLLVPHVLGVRIDLLSHFISQSWLMTFTLV